MGRSGKASEVKNSMGGTHGVQEGQARCEIRRQKGCRVSEMDLSKIGCSGKKHSHVGDTLKVRGVFQAAPGSCGKCAWQS